MADEPPESERAEPAHEDDSELNALEEDDELPPRAGRSPDGDQLRTRSRSTAKPDASPLPPHPDDVAPLPEPGPAVPPHPADPPPSPAPSRRTTSPLRTSIRRPRSTSSSPRTRHGDDVLETTPEFLQDAPEHDRLWFEQRPPRDFDFDG